MFLVMSLVGNDGNNFDLFLTASPYRVEHEFVRFAKSKPCPILTHEHPCQLIYTWYGAMIQLALSNPMIVCCRGKGLLFHGQFCTPSVWTKGKARWEVKVLMQLQQCISNPLCMGGIRIACINLFVWL